MSAWRRASTVVTPQRASLIAVLMAAGLIDTWDLAVNGFANTYYAAAAVAGSRDWTAFFFGSFDAGGFITIDKPPLGLWPMDLSVRLFGLSPWSVLVPQALIGMASVFVLYRVVRRSFGHAAGLIAAVVLALTPVAVLLDRFDDPDALLVLLLLLAAWAFLRALDDGRFRWLLAASVLVGLAFDTKYLEAWLVLPAFAVTYLVAAAGSIRHRLAGLTVSAATVLLTSGLWLVIVDLIPAGQRPYIGGSTNDTALDLVLGYDGFGRIFGQLDPGVAASGGTVFGGATGPLRMFDAEFGGQISWLLPVAMIALLTGLWVRRRAARLDPQRAAYLTWGLWLASFVAVFSLMSGIVHPYYAIALAPAIAALVGAGGVELWTLRSRSRVARFALAFALVGGAGWAFELLARTPGFAPGLGIGIVVVGVVAAIVVAVPPSVMLSGQRRGVSLVALSVGGVALLAGPAVYSLATITSGHAAVDPLAGPNGASAVERDAADAGALAPYLVAHRGTATWIVATSQSLADEIEIATQEPVMAMGGFSGGDPTPTVGGLAADIARGALRYVLIVAGSAPTDHPPRPDTGDEPGAASPPPAPSIDPSGSSEELREAWVRANCAAIDLSGLGPTAGLGENVLYDCAPTT